MKAPKRFVVEFETTDDGGLSHKLVEVTGEKNIVYCTDDGEDEWHGIPIEEILEYALLGDYGGVNSMDNRRIIQQARDIIKSLTE